MNLVWKLLKQNINKSQLIGSFIANLLGLSIVLLGIQFYTDISPLLSGQQDSLIKKDFLIITKKVNLLTTLGGNSTSFSQKEIDKIKNASFTKDVGAFTSSRYSVYGGINTKQGGFRTEMFFEAIPNNFIDVKTEGWQFTSGDKLIPIIIPKNYLDLYNFGFAEARSMPKLTPNMIGLVNLDITLSGQSQVQGFKGRIIGFSNRINTILVPESFMVWANEKFSSEKNALPSRIMIEVNNPMDPNIATFLQENNYEVEGESDALSSMSYFLKIVIGIVITIGIIICLLSFFVLLLSISLLLEKNKEKLQNLHLIGYSKSRIMRPYYRLSMGIHLVSLILAIGIVFIVRTIYMGYIREIRPDTEGNLFVMILTGVGIFAVLSILSRKFKKAL
ncbi:ABC transporter permease [Bacteroides sp. 224]|nr:ABC transporter permease [Bacteroides sp. 224]